MYWLASYPKSGNTWLRMLIENHVQAVPGGIGINDLPNPNVPYSRHFVDDVLGVSSAHLPDRKLDLLRPLVYAAMAERPQFRHMRTHESFRRNAAGESVFGQASTDGVVLLVRNPLDVAVSMARFRGVDIDTAIAQLNDDAYSLYPQPNNIADQLPQLVGSWSEHASSWLDGGQRLLLVRFEDLVDDVSATFARIVGFLQLSTDPERERDAIAHSAMGRLQAQERQTGFRELTTESPSFFAVGTAGQWRTTLRADQVAAVVTAHAPMMQRVGYDLP